MQVILAAFFSFRGRMNIPDYCIVLAGAVILLSLALFAGYMKLTLITIPAIIACKWALLAALAKRFHDIGWSGAACLLTFIPFVGFATYFVLMAVEGTQGPNIYGNERFFFTTEPSRESSQRKIQME